MNDLTLLPFRFRRRHQGDYLCVSEAGDFIKLDRTELEGLIRAPTELPLHRVFELKAKFFLASNKATGVMRLLASRVVTKKATLLDGPSLHIIVPTLFCEHSCQYCQVSRSSSENRFSMSTEDIDAACLRIFESPAPTLTVEFQGGDPLLRFDLVKRAILNITETNKTEKRQLRFVVASTLHQLTEQMCEFFKEFDVKLSTSLDGPEWLHNKNRPKKERNSYALTIKGLDMARRLIADDAVSALTTITRASLAHPHEIVDEYAERDLGDIFLRSLSNYGFARRRNAGFGYTWKEFADFYRMAFDHIETLNHSGVAIREVGATLLLRKILSPHDPGYVDLQSPTGAGLAALVYNYDGYIYPSDEARMLAETGDTSLRLGRITESLKNALNTSTQRNLIEASINWFNPVCSRCVNLPYCGPDPVAAYNQLGTMMAPVTLTDHCVRHTWLFSFLFEKLLDPHNSFTSLAERWASRAH